MVAATKSYRSLRASAGTGKTYQLVHNYVALVVEGGLLPSQIVTITFTRKAAGELKARIRERLRQEAARRPDRVTPAVLYDLARAPITNFHGLALQLLRDFGVAAGFGEGMRVLGEQGDDRLLFLEACEEAWFGGEAAVAHAVERLSTHLAVDAALPPALWTALARAREDSEPLDAARLLGSYDPAGVRAHIHAQLLELRARLAAAAIGGKGQEAIEQFLAAGTPELNAPYDEWAAGWQRATGHLHRRGRLGTLLGEEEMQLFKGPQARVWQPAVEALCAGAVESLACLIDAAWQRYQLSKQRQRAVDFGDLVERVVALLESHEPLYEQVRARFAAVLVDEAQDTNRLQRRFVHLLAGLDAVDLGAATPATRRERPTGAVAEPASLVVVGDWKQSIYTFRGADPKSFAAFIDDVRALGGRDEQLTVSRRSCPELVRGINHWGATAFAMFGAPYEPLEPLLAGRGVPDALGRPAMSWVELPPGAPGAAAALAEAQAVAALVHQRVAQGGAQAGDFALLLAAMTHAPLYAAALADAGIAAVLGGGGGLYSQPEIMDMVAQLVWLCDSTDPLAAAVALRSPLWGLSDSGLLALLGPAARQEGDRNRLLQLRCGAVAVPLQELQPVDREVLAHVAQVLPSLVAAAKVMPAGDLVSFVLERLPVRAVYLGLDGGEQRAANLDRFLALARAFDAAGRGSSWRFVREQVGRMEARHAEPVATVTAAARRAVQISSVHQAKGLQYPCVLLADLRRHGRRDFSIVRYHRDTGLVFQPRGRTGERLASLRWQKAVQLEQENALSERGRLLYVALTRAEREIVFFGRLEAAASAAKKGFHAFLGPWVEAAEKEGVLVRVAAGAPVRRDPTPSAAVERGSAWRWAQEVVARAAHVQPHTTAMRLVLPVTTLETYVQCLRRGFFVHDAHLVEPGSQAPAPAQEPTGEAREPSLDPRSRGRLAHLALAQLDRINHFVSVRAFVESVVEGQGFAAADPRLAPVLHDVVAFLTTPLGRRLRALESEQRRPELPFRLEITAAPHTVVLHGQIDLLYWEGGGPVVLDYKLSRPPRAGVGEAYATQLRAYAWAAARLCNFSGSVRTRLVFLRGTVVPAEQQVTPQLQEQFEHQVVRVAHALAALRLREGPYPSQPKHVCAALGCGFMARCHG